MLILFSDIWRVAAGLLLLIFANIIFGSATAQIKQSFDIKVFAAGVLKGFAIAAGIIMVYIAGYLNPDISFEFLGSVVTVKAAVNAMMLSAYIAYAIKDGNAIIGIFKIKSSDTSSASTSAPTATGETVAASADTQAGGGVEAGKTE